MSELITGLDVGSAYVRGVVVEQKKEGVLSVVTAFKYPSAGIKKGVITDTEEATTVLRDIAVDLQKISKRATANVFVNINSDHIKSRISRGIVAVQRADQEINADDVERVLQASQAVKLNPNYAVLHNIVREFFVDDVGDIQDPVGMTGNRLEVSTVIIEAFAPHVSMLIKNLERVGFRIGGVIFNPLAASRAVLTKRQKDLGVLCIDFGFGTTSFAIYEEGKVLLTKSIPIGAGFVTNDIAVGLQLSIDAAEKLKTLYGFGLARDISRREMLKLKEIDPANPGETSRHFLAEIIESRLAEIIDFVNNELKAVGKGIQLPGGAVIIGSGVKLGGMTELLRYKLKLPVQIGFPDLQHLEIANPAHHELLDDPEFATAIGLVLWGSDEKKQAHRVGGGGGIKAFFKNLMP